MDGRSTCMMMVTTMMIIVASCETVIDGPDPGRFLIVDPPGPRRDAGPDDLPPPPPPPPPPPACVEDAVEPNDDQGAATALVSGAAQVAQACGDNADWFSISAGTGCVVRYEVAVDEDDYARGGDVDAVLVDANGSVLSASSGLSRVDTGRVQRDASGLVGLRIRGSADEDTSYQLRFDVDCNADVCPADDAREDNDSAATATVIDEGVVFDGAACGADDDFFALPVRTGCVADVRLDFTDSSNQGADDLDLQLIDGDGATLLSSAGTDDDESLLVAAPNPAWLRVFLFQGAQNPTTGNDYRLVVSEHCANDFACPGDDIFEPNEDAASAKPILPTGELPGRTCGANEDFFAMTPGACPVTIDVLFNHGDGDIDCQLLTTDGTVLTTSSSSDDDEQLIAASGTSRVIIRVFGFQDQENGYTLRTTPNCP